MSFDHWISLLGLIVSTLGLAVTITGGILAILGYRKIIKSTDENAKERREEIERSGLQTKRDKFYVAAFMTVIAIFCFLLTRDIGKLKKRRDDEAVSFAKLTAVSLSQYLSPQYLSVVSFSVGLLFFVTRLTVSLYGLTEN